MPRRPTALHGVAVLLIFPDHRLSNSASIRVDAPGAELSIRVHRIPMVRRETPHLAHGAGGASSYRSVPCGRETLGRSLRPAGSCTASICIERSVARHARLARLLRFLSDRLPGSLHAPQLMRTALRVVESDRESMHTAPERADGRAPARGVPVRAGKPWTVDSGECALHHVNVRNPCWNVDPRRRGKSWTRKTQIASPMIA